MFGPPSIRMAWPWYWICPTWHAVQLSPIIWMPEIADGANEMPTGSPNGFPGPFGSGISP